MKPGGQAQWQLVLLQWPGCLLMVAKLFLFHVVAAVFFPCSFVVVYQPSAGGRETSQGATSSTRGGWKGWAFGRLVPVDALASCLWCYTGVTWATCKAYLLFYQAAGSPDPFQCHYFCKYSRSWALARPRRHSLHRLLQTFQTYWHRWSRLHESDGLSCVTSSAIPCMGPFWYTIWADVYPMLPFLSQHSRALLDSDLGKAASDLNKEHLLTNGKAGIPSLWPPGFAWLWTLVRCTTEHRWMGSSTMAPGLARIFQHISGPDCGAAWGEHLKEVNLGLEVERRVLESTP